MRSLLLVLLVACGPSEPAPDPSAAPSESPEATERIEAQGLAALPEGVDAQVTRITDGDTIRVELDGRNQRVRYIGIDTPETRHSPRGPQPYGDEASAANRRLVEGQQVRLVFDVEERDRYGRLLAYVYRSDGTFVNAALIEQGYARILTVPPNVRHADELRQLERRAREARRGLWGLPRR